MGDSLYIQVAVVVEPDGDGYHAYCPNLKGLHMDGKTGEATAGPAPAEP